MKEGAITSTAAVSVDDVKTSVQLQRRIGSLNIVFLENSIEMEFEGDVKGRQLDSAIRLISRRYRMWRNTQLAIAKKEK